MNALDYTIFGAYLVGILWLGLGLRGKAGTPREYFLAGRSMRAFPVGLSIMVTVFNAVNYTALPTEVLQYGLYVTIAFPMLFLVGWPVTRIFIPFYHRMRLTSAYAYLEARFDVRVRSLASVLFVFWRILWMATALYAAAKVLQALTGLDWRWLAVLAGAGSAAYTAAGGLRAVMWTDVAQFFVLAGGIVAAAVLTAVQNPGGVGGIVRMAAEGGLLRPFHPLDPSFFSLDPTLRITLWSGTIGALTAFVARYGADQMVVQRYFSARSERAAKKGFWLSAWLTLAVLSMLVFMGMTLYARVRQTGATLAGPDGLAALAGLIRALPYGACGLVAAGLLAATMSSVDSGMNSCCAAIMTDLYPRYRRGAPGPSSPPPETGDESGAVVTKSRWLVGGLALFVLLLCFAVARLGSLFVIANRIVNGLGSPLLGIILCGMFSRRANSRGVLIGGIVGALWSVTVSFGVTSLALHYYAVVNLLGTLAACWIFSWTTLQRDPHASDAGQEWLWQARLSR